MKSDFREFGLDEKYYRRSLICAAHADAAGMRMLEKLRFGTPENEVVFMGMVAARGEARQSLDMLGGMAGVW